MYTAHKSLQKIANLMVRLLTRPHFLDSYGQVMLLWCWHITEEASQFRSKFPKIILTVRLITICNTFIDYTILFCSYSYSVCETRLIDCHKTIFMILKSTFKNLPQTQIFNGTKFCNDLDQELLKGEMHSHYINSYSKLTEIFPYTTWEACSFKD